MDVCINSQIVEACNNRLYIIRTWIKQKLRFSSTTNLTDNTLEFITLGFFVRNGMFVVVISLKFNQTKITKKITSFLETKHIKSVFNRE